MHQAPPLSPRAVAAAAALAASTSALGDFVGLQVVHHATVTTAAGQRSVYRIYATFTAGADQLLSWGSPSGFTGEIHTGPCTGTAFFNPGGNTAPHQSVIDEFPELQWDTFATIGVSIADQATPSDQTALSPGFPTFISGNQVTLNNALVAAPVKATQGRADFAGDGDPELRVLMMQLTVRPDQFPYGSIGRLSYRNSDGQTVSLNNLSWIGLAAHGRCCVPDGTCVLTYHSSCAQFLNGFFLTGCEPCATCSGTCVADIAPHPGDGHVDVNDILAVIGGWGPCPAFNVCPPDVAPPPYGDDTVDVNDLLIVIGAWGECSP